MQSLQLLSNPAETYSRHNSLVSLLGCLKEPVAEEKRGIHANLWLVALPPLELSHLFLFFLCICKNNKTRPCTWIESHSLEPHIQIHIHTYTRNDTHDTSFRK